MARLQLFAVMTAAFSARTGLCETVMLAMVSFRCCSAKRCLYTLPRSQLPAEARDLTAAFLPRPLMQRDGVKLHTEYDLPLFYQPGSRIAAVLERSPYGANAEELIADIFGETLGFVSVRQDMRGTKQSEGAFGIWHDSQPDAFDTISWITNQTWSNGVVFTTGASADAIDELAQISGPHPALRGQVR